MDMRFLDEMEDDSPPPPPPPPRSKAARRTRREEGRARAPGEPVEGAGLGASEAPRSGGPLADRTNAPSPAPREGMDALTPELNARTAANRETPPARKRRRLEDDTADAASAAEKIQREVDELARQFGAEPLRVTSGEDNARGKTRSRVPKKPPVADSFPEVFGDEMMDEDVIICGRCGQGESCGMRYSRVDPDVIICSKCHNKERRLICSEPGCRNQARSAGGKCYRHGGCNRRICSEPGCKTLAIGGGERCYRHGGGNRRICSICSEPGCETPARSAGGKCYRHGGGGNRRICSEPGCKTLAIGGGERCYRHGKTDEDEDEDEEDEE